MFRYKRDYEPGEIPETGYNDIHKYPEDFKPYESYSSLNWGFYGGLAFLWARKLKNLIAINLKKL